MRLRSLVLLIAACLLAPSAAAAADDCTIPKRLGVAFVVDDSGSMSTSDPGELRAQATEIGIDSMPDGSVAAAGSFDTTAREFFGPSEVTPATRADLESKLYFAASGNTDYERAFLQAKRELDAMTGVDKRAVVFLSDGIPTTSYSTDDDLAKASVPIFTIGFGDAPVAELAGIAARSGGQAYAIETPGDAQSVFGQIVARLTCDASVTTSTVALAPGETKAVPFDVGATDREFRALAAWDYGDVTVSLRRPDGSSMSAASLLGGETFFADSTYALGRAINPAVGGWSLVLTAPAENIDAVDVAIDVFRRQYPIAPDPVALVAPAAGTSVRAGDPLAVTWTPARGAATYEILDGDTVLKSGLTGTTATVAMPLALGPHAIRVRARNAFGQQDTAAAPVITTPRGSAVLVPGLHEESTLLRGDAPGADPCGGLHDFATLCLRLRSRGFAVWAPGDRGNASGAEEIDNRGDLERNAAHLRAFTKKYLGDRPAIYVGHSMGGLIARKAISTDGMPAAGLLTLGTPHDGSFWADAALGASFLFCPGVCTAVRAAAKGISAAVGPQALADMTRIARAADKMKALKVPAWALAGTAVDLHVPSWVPGAEYFTPNDVAVGLSSALGRSANLGIGDDHRFTVSTWHVKKLGALGFTLPGGDHVGDSEFDDSEVLDRVAGAVDSLPAQAIAAPAAATVRRATAGAAGARAKRRKPKKVKPVPQASVLPAVAAQEVGSAPSAADGMLYSTKPFMLSCAGQAPVPAVAVAEDLMVADPDAAPCRRPSVTAGHGVDVVRSVDTARARVRATVTTRGLRLVVTAKRRIAGVRVDVSGKPVRLRVRSRTGRRWTADVVARRGSAVRVTVQVGDRVYRTVARR